MSFTEISLVSDAASGRPSAADICPSNGTPYLVHNGTFRAATHKLGLVYVYTYSTSVISLGVPVIVVVQNPVES
jgi:hypothetical protein